MCDEFEEHLWTSSKIAWWLNDLKEIIYMMSCGLIIVIFKKI